MGKLKVHELAKELGLESKQLIAKAKEVGIEVTSHLSSLEEEQVSKIREIFGKKENKGVKTQKNMEQEKNKEKKEKTTKKDATPVIIRREVILADEDKQEKKQEKTERKDVGFVERKNNKDFNIVYRKQQVKPMTVSELFGLKPNKKEEKDVHDFLYTELEESMKQILGSKVSIKNKKNNKGKIEIEYYSRDELERIVDMIRSI